MYIVYNIYSFLCVTFVTLANGRRAAYTPSPFPGTAHGRLPPSKFFIFSTPPHQFFYFFHPQSLLYPFLCRFCPFFLPLTGFLCFCVYFIVCVFFVALWAKKIGHKKRAGRMLCVLSALSVVSCYFLCRNDVLFFCGSIVLMLPFVIGVMRS